MVKCQKARLAILGDGCYCSSLRLEIVQISGKDKSETLSSDMSVSCLTTQIYEKELRNLATQKCARFSFTMQNRDL